MAVDAAAKARSGFLALFSSSQQLLNSKKGGPHQATYDLRDSSGKVKAQSTKPVESGGSGLGRRLSWPEQRATDTEVKNPARGRASH